jgi:hypothetical protein
MTTTPAPQVTSLAAVRAKRAHPAGDGDSNGEPVAPPRSTSPTLVHHRPIPFELDDRLVHDILSLSLMLSSARCTNRGLASIRLASALDGLDGLVRELHRVALGALVPDAARPRPADAPTDDPASAATDPDLIDQAERSLEQVDDELVGLWVYAMADTGHDGVRDRLTEATRFVRLARVALTSTAVR